MRLPVAVGIPHREAPDDLAERQALVAHPGEDLAHHLGLLDHGLVAGLDAIPAADVAVAVRRLRARAHRTRPGSVPLAPARPLQERGPLVLRHDPLHLQQQRVLGGRAQRPVQEHDLHARARELLDEQHLVGVPAREAVGGVHVEPVEAADGREVAQPLQRRPHERRAADTVVDELALLGRLRAAARRGRAGPPPGSRWSPLPPGGRTRRARRGPRGPSLIPPCRRRAALGPGRAWPPLHRPPRGRDQPRGGALDARPREPFRLEHYPHHQPDHRVPVSHPQVLPAEREP